LEDQLKIIQSKSTEIKSKNSELLAIEKLALKLEAANVFENKYTEHSAVSLSQKHEALKQLCVVMEFNTEQKISAQNSAGVSKEQIKEWQETFEYYDTDGNKTLDYFEFKSCLRSCGKFFFFFEFLLEKKKHSCSFFFFFLKFLRF